MVISFYYSSEIKSENKSARYRGTFVGVRDNLGNIWQAIKSSEEEEGGSLLLLLRGCKLRKAGVDQPAIQKDMGNGGFGARKVKAFILKNSYTKRAVEKDLQRLHVN